MSGVPEGDSVVRTARLLDRALAGQVLAECQFRVPALATADLRGATVLGTDTHGKHLFTRFDLAGERVTIHSHLGMDGAWSAAPLARPARLGAEVRVVWASAQTRVLGTSLKTVALLGPEAEDALHERLGPDLLGADFEDELPLALRRAEERTHPPTQSAGNDHRDVASTLLDQRVASGMGTVLVSETLYLLGVSPHRSADTVDLARVYRKARQILHHSVRTGRRVTTGNLRRGQSYWVYGRENHPCRRCGTRVVRETFSEYERSIWSCPACQPPL